MLRIDVDGGVWLKPGAAIAYRGNIRFERLPTLSAGAPVDAAVTLKINTSLRVEQGVPFQFDVQAINVPSRLLLQRGVSQ